MQSMTSRWRSSVSRSIPLTQSPQSKLFIASSGIAAQSTSFQHAPWAVFGGSGHWLRAPPSAHSPRAPSVVSSPALHAASSNRRLSRLAAVIGPHHIAVLLPHQISDRNIGQALRDQLGDVEHGDLLLDVPLLHAVGQHDVAERARDRDRLHARIDDLVGAVEVDALALVLLHEHAAAAGAAAEAVALVALELLDVRHAGRLDHRARRVELAVPPAEVAAVVIGDGADRRLVALERAALVEVIDQLR